jgi:hypothetical protein
MMVFDTLIKSCHIHLPLFGKHVIASCKLLLTTRPQSSSVAVATFGTYVSHVDDMTQLDWLFFVQHFNKMISPSNTEEIRQVHVVFLLVCVDLMMLFRVVWPVWLRSFNQQKILTRL